MNFKTTIILLFVLAAVGGYLLFAGGEEPQKIAREATPATIVPVTSDKITKVTITPTGGETIQFEKQGEDWRMTKPLQTATRDNSVEGLLTQITGLQSRGELEDKSVATGLDKPAYQVEVEGVGGVKSNVKIGQRSLVGNNLYVQVDGGPVKVVEAKLIEQLEKPFSDYRRLELTDAEQEEVSAITLTSPDQSIVLEKQDGKWQMLEPINVAADEERMSSMAQDFTLLRATEYMEQGATPSSLGLDRPQLKLVVKTSPTPQPTTQSTTQPAGESKTTTILFGRYEDVLRRHVFAMVEGDNSIAKVTAETMDKFKVQPLMVRDRQVANFPQDKVKSIAIIQDFDARTEPTTREASRTEKLLVLETVEITPEGPVTQPTTDATTQPATRQAWILKADGKSTPANEEAVKELLNLLAPLKARRYLTSEQFTPSSDRFIYRVTVDEDGQNKVHEIVVHDIDGSEDPYVVYNGLQFETDPGLLGQARVNYSHQPSSDGADFNLNP